MNAGRLVWISAALLLGVLGTEAEAGSTARDFSGDAMQRHGSRMMSSPVMRFPGPLGISHWPYIAYPPAPSITIVHIQVHIPESEPRPTVPPAPPARPKFWTARCGGFVELEASQAANLMEEEQKPCAP